MRLPDFLSDVASQRRPLAHGAGDVAIEPDVPPGQAPADDDIAYDLSTWRLVLRVFVQSKLAVIGLVIIILFLLFSFVGPLVYHTNQIRVNLTQLTRPPSASHLLGTDDLGYDVLGRLMVGGQSSLEVGLAAALLASVVGTIYGAISGFVGGWIDGLMMRVLDSLLALPSLLLVLVVASIVTPTIPVLIGVITLVAWLVPARLVRGETLAIRTRPYVEAGQAAGARALRLIARHVVPNVIGIVIVQTTLAVADAILLLAALGFLGLGPPPPATNWGAMLSNGLNYIYDGYWWLIYPAGLCIVLTVISFNFLGDALRDAFEVRLRQR
ncbi:MAG: ABC transporter permease [Streptosporangiaceae bacterium]